MRILPLAPLLPLPCSKSADRLQGKWEFDAATYELIPKYQSLSVEGKKHWVDTAQFDLTITEDTLSIEQKLPGWGNRSSKGRYELEEVDGKRVTVMTILDGKPERLVFSVQENVLRFGLKGRSIILKRASDR
ncbi:MAG: hypothetical protein ACYTHK_05950 [Planctomycetota bacterium]